MDQVLAANLILLCVLPLSYGCGSILFGSTPEQAQDDSAKLFVGLAALTGVFWMAVLLGAASTIT